MADEGRAELTGEIGAHDPSSLVKDASRYYYFATGPGIVSRSSTDQTNWIGGAPVFNTPPAWTQQAVPSFEGLFWAPDIAYFNGKYHLYYSVSSWGTIDSAIGLVTSPSLTNPTWTDQGKVVQSDAAWEAGPNTDTTAYNAIDPSVLVDTNGSVWMAFGSYFSGIVVTQLNPATGKRLNTSTLNATQVANNAPGGGWGSSIEGAALAKRGDFYYLFVNYGSCCSGVDSTYDIRVGRSLSPTGPFLDKNGTDMRSGGGTLFLDDDGKRIGPGHFEIFSESGQDQFGYHYYDGDRNGAPTYELRDLFWTADDWPSHAAVNPNWTGTISSGWATAANWSDGVPNGPGHVANFGSLLSGRYLVSLDSAGRTVGTLNFSGNGSYTVGNTGHVLTLDAAVTGDSATINVSAGNHMVAAPVAAQDHLGVNVTPSSSRLSLTGAVSAPGLTKYGRGTLSLNAANAYAGSVFVKWGTLDITGSVTAGRFSSVGHVANENATMIVRGAGSFSVNADLNIGDSGDAVTPATGTLELRDNASITIGSAGGFFVASGFFANTRAVGAVNQTGGTLTANGNFDGAFIIGGRNSHRPSGSYHLSGGTVNANTNVQVGGRGTGIINQTGGAFHASGYVAIGRHTGSTGTWTLSGGTLHLTDASRMLIVGEAGVGTLNLGGTAQVSTAAPLRIGHASSGIGIVNLDGGTITTPSISRGSGTGTFNFNGGTLRAAGSHAAFMQGLTAAHIGGGGAVIDSNGFDVTVAQPLRGASGSSGGLTKNGTGTVALAAPANVYSGPTHVAAGTLAIADTGTRNNILKGGALTIAADARLDLANNKLITTTPVGTATNFVYDGVSGQVQRAFNGGKWDQPGLTTSMPDALSGLTSIGVASGQQVRGLGPSDTALFAGQTITGASTIAMYTYAGDANLDGLVSGDDYTAIDFAIAAPGADGWVNGDFNYDGSISGDDYTIIDFNIAAQGAPFPTSGTVTVTTAATVPEPVSVTPMVLAFSCLLGRRRRPVRMARREMRRGEAGLITRGHEGRAGRRQS